MNWYKKALEITQFPSEEDEHEIEEFEHNYEMDYYETMDRVEDVFSKNKIRPKNSTPLSHILHDEDNIHGGLYSEWSMYGDKITYSADIAMNKNSRSVENFNQILEHGMQEYEMYKEHMQQAYGTDSQIRLEIVNPMLAVLIFRKYENYFDEVYYNINIPMNSYQELYQRIKQKKGFYNTIFIKIN